MSKKQYVRKIFKTGSNGNTSSDVVTIPKKIIQQLGLEGIKVMISLDDENTIKITKYDDAELKKISKVKEQVHDFASWE
ncbi:MAG: hypothetical protein J4F36_04030 [Nitrosopumilaceae archaeon]|nr:hypothetical protein [Nitrosopumilaceae archaeon]